MLLFIFTYMNLLKYIELGLLGESALTVSALSPVASNNSYVASDERTEGKNIICTV